MQCIIFIHFRCLLQRGLISANGMGLQLFSQPSLLSISLQVVEIISLLINKPETLKSLPLRIMSASASEVIVATIASIATVFLRSIFFLTKMSIFIYSLKKQTVASHRSLIQYTCSKARDSRKEVNIWM